MEARPEVYEKRWIALPVLCLSLVLVVMGNTVLNVTLPTLVVELDASATELGWIVDSYSLVFAGLLITAGALGDRFGRKYALNIGLVLFAASSVAASFADSPEFLIATRVVMGIGAAFVMPATLSILTNIFDGPERSRAIAIWSGLAGAGGAIGPIAGGWLLEQFNWGAAFLVNVPFVILAMIAGYFVIPNSKDPSKPRLDFVGAGLSTLGLAALLFAIIEAPDNGWTSVETLGAAALAVVVLAGFVAYELRIDQPILDMSLFKKARFSAASFSIMLAFFAMFGFFFILTQYLQFVRGYSALETGIRVLPVPIGLIIGAPLSARVVEKIGSKLVVTIGLLLATGGLVVLSQLDVDSPYLQLAGGLFMAGFGMGWVMATATESIMGSLPLAKAGVGSAVNDTTRELGGALGVGVLGSALATVYRNSLGDDLDLLALPEAQHELATDSVGGLIQVAARLPADIGGPLIEVGNASFVDGLQIAFLIGAAITLSGAIFAYFALPARAPEYYDETALPEPEGEPEPSEASL